MQTAAAKAITRELVDIEIEAKAYAAAMAAVANNYVLSDEITQFKQEVESTATRLQASYRYCNCPCLPCSSLQFL